VIDCEALPPLLHHHLARQRWSGAADQEITSVELAWCETVDKGPPALTWLGAKVGFADGRTQTYQLFLGARPADEEHEFLQGKHRELVGQSGDALIYDALIDPDLAIEVLHLVDPEREVEVRRPLVLEHSNSSVVYDEAIILKIFRRVEPGPNPDIEIPRVLASLGIESVMAPLASLRREGIDLAVLRNFLLGATEGWQLAHTSVRDVLASRLPPEECGGDFAPDAERLGATLAGLHLGLASAFGVEPGDPASWADDMVSHVDELASAASEIPVDAAEVTRSFERLRDVSAAGATITVHGDLHLAQAMLADPGWYVLDWEGEPTRRRDERFTRSSPLRDVAGMLRSLHYAIAMTLAEWDEDDGELVDLAGAWEQRNRAAFLAGYLSVEGIEALLPPAGVDRDTVLGAFELDKAVYEVGYELGHRPELVPIPAGAITRLLG
jgi:maltokinase